MNPLPRRYRKHIAEHHTPQQVQRWLHSLDYNPKDTMHALPGVMRTQRAHCLEGALSAAAILEHHGFSPLILDLESADLLDHTLFLFQNNGKYGTVGMSKDIGLHGRAPVFSSIEALVQSYVIPYIDEQAVLETWGVLDLHTINGRWRNADHHVWYVEEALRNIPHRRVRTPRSEVARWRQRYLDFKQAHPGRQPDYFPGQNHWL